MKKLKILLAPKNNGISYDILASAIANLDFDEKIVWSFINEVDDEIMMESIIVSKDNKVSLVSNACGGGYELNAEIDGLGDNIGIESALQNGYGTYGYKVKEIYG